MSQSFIVQGGIQPHVLAWSIDRLQFDGKGWQREFRDAIRTHLRALPGRADDRVLYAVYEAADIGEFVDVENVLLYNVGSACMRHLMTGGVRFERAYVEPPPPPHHLSSAARHLHRYRLADREDGFLHWQPAELLASFDQVAVERLDKPTPIWVAMRRQATPPSGPKPAPVRFLANLRLSGPQRVGRRRDVANLVKPLLDGVLSAYHCDAEPDREAIARLAKASFDDPESISAALVDARWAALGPRRLVRPFGVGGVQWNPADDFCVAAEVLLEPQPTEGGWQISGDIHVAVQSQPTP